MRDGFVDREVLRFPGRWSQPWPGVNIVFPSVRDLKADYLAACRGLHGDSFDILSGNRDQRC